MTPDKREIIAQCLRDRHTSADAILNALHQSGWQITPKTNEARIEQDLENRQVRRLRDTGRCPVCGAEER